MGLKGTKFLQDLDIIFLWQFEFSRPLGGEQGQTEHLAEGRAQGPRSSGAQGGRLSGSSGWARGERRLPSGTLGQLLLLIVVIVILLRVISVWRKCHFLRDA